MVIRRVKSKRLGETPGRSLISSKTDVTSCRPAMNSRLRSKETVSRRLSCGTAGSTDSESEGWTWVSDVDRRSSSAEEHPVSYRK
jgi:hypothetical protein